MIKVSMIRLMAAWLTGHHIEPQGPIESEGARRLAEDLDNDKEPISYPIPSQGRWRRAGSMPSASTVSASARRRKAQSAGSTNRGATPTSTAGGAATAPPAPPPPPPKGAAAGRDAHEYGGEDGDRSPGLAALLDEGGGGAPELLRTGPRDQGRDTGEPDRGDRVDAEGGEHPAPVAALGAAEPEQRGEDDADDGGAARGGDHRPVR